MPPEGEEQKTVVCQFCGKPGILPEPSQIEVKVYCADFSWTKEFWASDEFVGCPQCLDKIDDICRKHAGQIRGEIASLKK